ncbi:MAG: hypothetical protein KME49_27395 [Brasilonema octagenarum HA4186-MV1]|jgi:hypothetical protein|nr:hypothetical protein [Brasilonema octagenarum HA4186-MV1]
MAKARESRFIKSHKFQVLVTETEKALIEEYAASHGLTVSNLMRELTLNHVNKVCQPVC